MVTRTFFAPRELVFKAWTDPKHLPQWWGPKQFTTTVQEIDVRPGGVWRYVIASIIYEKAAIKTIPIKQKQIIERLFENEASRHIPITLWGLLNRSVRAGETPRWLFLQ